jgi:hypothetical protein
MLANNSRPVPTHSSGDGARPVGVRAVNSSSRAAAMILVSAVGWPSRSRRYSAG